MARSYGNNHDLRTPMVQRVEYFTKITGELYILQDSHRCEELEALFTGTDPRFWA